MALMIDGKADRIRVLSDLSGLVVGALLDESDVRPSEGSAFAAALRRYEQEGQPPELSGPWRRAIAPPPVLADDRAAGVLRILARDLLACLAASPATVDGAETEPETPPPNVHPIGGPMAAVPALELASDGTWRPATSGISSANEIEAGRRPAYVPTLGSRYPEISETQGQHTLLPPPPSARPASFSQLPPAPPVGRTDAPPPPPSRATTPPVVAPRPATPAPDLAMSTESVIQAVSGGTELVAGPFARFQQLADFIRALRALHGVREITTRQFVRGMVHLRVQYSDTTALETRISEITEFSPTILSSTPSRIEVRVQPPDDAPPAQG